MNKLDLTIFKPLSYFTLVVSALALFNNRLALISPVVLNAVSWATQSLEALNGISETFLILFLFWFGHHIVFNDATHHLHHSHKSESELGKERESKEKDMSHAQRLGEKLMKWFGAISCATAIGLFLRPFLQTPWDLHSIVGLGLAAFCTWIGRNEAEQYYEGLKSQLSFNPHETLERGMKLCFKWQGEVIAGRVDAVFARFFTITGTVNGVTYTVKLPMTANRFRIEEEPAAKARKPGKKNGKGGCKDKGGNGLNARPPVLRGEHHNEEAEELEVEDMIEEELGINEEHMNPSPLLAMSPMAGAENAHGDKREKKKCALGNKCPENLETVQPALYCSLIDQMQMQERQGAQDNPDNT